MSFFFDDTKSTKIYTLSLHDALPISVLYMVQPAHRLAGARDCALDAKPDGCHRADRRRATHRRSARWHPRSKSTRLNSSHVSISYAVFCLKKKIEIIL